MAADSFPQRLTAIDDRTRGDHWYLRRTDVCRYLGAYTAGKGFAYSATNGLILDFKMAVPPAGERQRRYKEDAMAAAATALRRALAGERDGRDGVRAGAAVAGERGRGLRRPPGAAAARRCGRNGRWTCES